MKTKWILALTAFCIIYALSSAPVPTAGKPSKLIESANAVPDRFIVVLADTPSLTDKTSDRVENLARDLAQSHRGSVERVFTRSLRGFAVEMSKSDAIELSNDPRVLFVEEDAEIWPSYTAQPLPDWGLDRIDQPTLPLNTNFVYERNGIGVNAYVIDSGINPSHIDFGGRASVAFDALSDGQNGIDCRGHGTHVAGIIGSSVHGVAKAVTLRGIRVLPCAGSGQISDLMAGVEWLTANRVLPAVANISINASGVSPAMSTSITNSINSGITYVVSAGNFNGDACNFSPANVSSALVAGASTASDNRAGYSNFGPCIDVWAPGHSITSTDYATNTGTRVMSGTSQASPMVAGVAALYLQNNPAASPATVHNAVRNNSTDNIVTNIDGTSTRRLLSSWLGSEPPVPGHVRIIKEVRLRNGGTASPTVFNFSASNFGPSSFSLVDNDSPPADLFENPSVYVFESQGAVTVTQAQTPGWTTSSITCVEEAMIDLPNLPNSTVNVINRTANIYVEQGETVTCTFVSEELAPTSAPITVSGRIATESGMGARNVMVVVSDAATGESWTAYTNTFGYYSFGSLPSSAFYLIQVYKDGRFTFTPPAHTFTADDDIFGMDFVAIPRTYHR